MAISSNNQQYQRSTRFVGLDELPKGTGETGRYVTDVTGILLGIEPRTGTYEVTDRNTGRKVTRPNSWTAHFADGSMFSWPTYADEDGRVHMWSRFDESIDLAQCIQQGIAIHLWKDERSFTHLELAEGNIPAYGAGYAAPWD